MRPVRVSAFTQHVVDRFHPAEGLQGVVFLSGQVGDGVFVGFLHEWTSHRRDFQDSEVVSKLHRLCVAGTCLQNSAGQRCDERNRVGHVRLEVGGSDVFARVQPAVGEFHLFGGVLALPAEGEYRRGQRLWGSGERVRV